MPQAKKGDTVKVHYTGKFNDGTVFDSSRGREPLEFQLGESQVIPGFENAVMGMETGEIKTENVAAEQGYGKHRKELVATVERHLIPEHIEPKVGQRLQVPHTDGGTMVVTVTEVSDDAVTLDGNHPLAGKKLNFEIELVEIM